MSNIVIILQIIQCRRFSEALINSAALLICFFVIARCPAGGGTHNKITIHIMKNIVSKKSEDNTMATYRVKWDELSQGAKHPAHKVTTVSATSMAEAKAKVRQRIFTNVKVTSITAVKIS